MKRSRADGYGGFLLYDLRFQPQGGEPRGFILDDPRYAGARILVSRRNFGTGSSREAAVYALWDFGIRCVIAPSFGDIFASNAVKNGLLPAIVTEDEAEALLRRAFGRCAAHRHRRPGRAGDRRTDIALASPSIRSGACSCSMAGTIST